LSGYLKISLMSCLFFCGALIAFAHGGHDERVKVRVSKDRLILDTHVPAFLLASFDSNQDGVLASREFLASKDEIKNWLGSQVTVKTSDNVALKPTYYDTPVSVGDLSQADSPVEHVRVLATYDFMPETPWVALEVKLYVGQIGHKNILIHKDGAYSRRAVDAQAPIQLLFDDL